MPPSIKLDVSVVKKLCGKSVSVSHFVVNDSFAFRAVDFNFSNLNFKNVANSKSKRFDELLWYCNEVLDVLFAFSGLGLKLNGFGFELVHFKHHKLVSDCSLKTLPLLTEVFSIKIYKPVSVSTYLVGK